VALTTLALTVEKGKAYNLLVDKPEGRKKNFENLDTDELTIKIIVYLKRTEWSGVA
jgi:hypothetical protein